MDVVDADNNTKNQPRTPPKIWSHPLTQETRQIRKTKTKNFPPQVSPFEIYATWPKQIPLPPLSFHLCTTLRPSLYLANQYGSLIPQMKTLI